MKMIRFAFADGHVLLVKPTDPVRLRHHAVYGVETCLAEKLLAGTYPDGGPAVDWRHVEGTGREHAMDGCRIEAGEVGPVGVPGPAGHQGLAGVAEPERVVVVQPADTPIAVVFGGDGPRGPAATAGATPVEDKAPKTKRKAKAS